MKMENNINAAASPCVDLKNDKVLIQLKSELENCIIYNKFVSVHLNTKNMQIRYCIAPEEVDISFDGLYVARDMFHLNITHRIDKAEYLGNNSYCITMGNIEFYVDFVEADCF